MIEVLISSDEMCEMVKISPTDSAEHLMSFGLHYLGEGVSRTVYKLSDSLVLKVKNERCTYAQHEEANAHEVALWEALDEDEREAGTFAKIFAWADDYTWVISELVPEIGCSSFWDERTDRDRELIRKYGVGDLHPDNYGLRHDGSFAVIDYGLTGSAAASSSDSYSCFDHNCPQCWPEGCDCDSFEGCHEGSHKCAVCAQYGAEARKVADCTMMPSAARYKARRMADSLEARNAETRAPVLWEGWTSAETEVVCRECADKLHLADVCEPDMAQGILQFPNRYAVGFETRTIYGSGQYIVRNGERVWAAGVNELRIVWFVRDRFLNDIVGYGRPDNGKHIYGRPIGQLDERCFGHDGFERACMLAEILNNGYNGCASANRQARLN